MTVRATKRLAFRAGLLILAASPLMLAGGCDESYATPGPTPTLSDPGVRQAQIQAGADWDVLDEAGEKPLASFPVAIAVARVQGEGNGCFAILSSHDVEDQGSIDELNKLPKVTGIAPIEPILTNGDSVSAPQIRRAAAQLHADLLLLYRLDTQSNTEDYAAPLSVLSLGLAPDQSIRVTSTASCVLLDTRNGYVYGICEASNRADALTIAWSDPAVIDGMTQQTESAAFKDMCRKISIGLWPSVLKNAGADAKD
jgi:hypothetical protein